MAEGLTIGQAVDAPLNRLFARLSSAFVHSGELASLSDPAEGAAVSLFGVIAVISSGYPDAGARCPTARLRRYAGLESDELVRAKQVLQTRDLATIRRDGRRGLWRVAIGTRVLARRAERSFKLPGRLIATGAWASLTRREQALALALAATAMWGVYVESEEWAAMPERVRNMLENRGSIEPDYSLEPDRAFVPLIGHTTPAEVAILAGVPQSDVLEVLDALAEADHATAAGIDEPLVVVDLGRDGIWYHLPPAWWGAERLCGDC